MFQYGDATDEAFDGGFQPFAAAAIDRLKVENLLDLVEVGVVVELDESGSVVLVVDVEGVVVLVDEVEELSAAVTICVGSGS